jgi:hypothetical protein
MSHPLQSDVQAHIDPLADEIMRIIHGAWQDWQSSPYPAVWRAKRSRANFVWEQMIERAEGAFNDVAEIRILAKNETCQFLVNGTVLFRLKKGDDNGLSSNIPTQLALKFHDHQENLFGLPDVQRVDIVYQLNELETEIRDILVVARDEDSVVWSYSILDRAANVERLPMEPPRTGTDTRSLVQPRDVAQDDRREKR